MKTVTLNCPLSIEIPYEMYVKYIQDKLDEEFKGKVPEIIESIRQQVNDRVDSLNVSFMVDGLVQKEVAASVKAAVASVIDLDGVRRAARAGLKQATAEAVAAALGHKVV